MARRDFRLPSADEEFLDGLGLAWDAIQEGATQWVILRGYSLPDGYSSTKVDIAIQISAGYPDTALDMVYLFPPVARIDQRPIPNTQGQVQIEQRTWQQWSRHRTAENKWVSGEDDLSSHVHYMESWFQSEFERVAS